MNRFIDEVLHKFGGLRRRCLILHLIDSIIKLQWINTYTYLVFSIILLCNLIIY